MLGVVTAAAAYGCGIAATRRLGARLASFVALSEVLAALVFAGLPSGLGLLIASPLGMATGAVVEAWSERRAHA